MVKYLLGRASTGKFRFFIIESSEKWDEEKRGFIIQRSYGQIGGKTTLSPEIIVGKKPSTKTWHDALELKFNSEVKKQLDKGYIEVEKDPNEYTESELSELFGEIKTDQQGIIKPQLAKQSEKVTNQKIFDNEWMISRKLDGVKALFYYQDGEIHTASRGGSDYDEATTHIREDKELLEFFERNPNIILDGELFKPGISLQQISGACRLEKGTKDTSWIQYWIYDCYDKNNPDTTAKERQKFLIKELNNNCTFSIYDGSHIDNTSCVIVLDQDIVSGWDNMKKLHDQYVAEGFEGAVIKDPNKCYKPGSRGNQLIKIKQYKSEDFVVTGYELGTRGSEDMVFICEMDDGRTFKAMPVGSREVKEEYVENFNNKYKNHKAECTFFNYSDEGIPTQSKLRCFRFDLE